MDSGLSPGWWGGGWRPPFFEMTDVHSLNSMWSFGKFGVIIPIMGVVIRQMRPARSVSPR